MKSALQPAHAPRLNYVTTVSRDIFGRAMPGTYFRAESAYFKREKDDSRDILTAFKDRRRFLDISSYEKQKKKFRVICTLSVCDTGKKRDDHQRAHAHHMWNSWQSVENVCMGDYETSDLWEISVAKRGNIWRVVCAGKFATTRKCELTRQWTLSDREDSMFAIICPVERAKQGHPTSILGK